MKIFVFKILSGIEHKIAIRNAGVLVRPAIGACLMFMFLGFNEKATAQTSEGNSITVLKDWESLHVSNPDLKIDYSVVDCNKSPKILLRLTNLSQSKASIAFKLNIIDTHSGIRILQEVQAVLSELETQEGFCGENGNPVLQIPVNVNIQPKHIYLAVTF